MDKKDQHTVPRSYLRAWCDPETPNGAFIWVFSKEQKQGRRRSPKSTFTQEDFYTLPGSGGQRDLSIENSLAALEGAFVLVRDSALKERRPLVDTERTDLLAFIAAMMTRTTRFTDHWRGQWSEVLGRMEKMQKELPLVKQRRSGIPIRKGESMGVEDVRRLATFTAQINLITIVPPLTEALSAMNLTILETNSQPGLITSDAPVVWFDPMAFTRPWPYNGHGLASPTIEISMPVSSTQAVLLTWRLESGYVSVADDLVMEMNRMARAHCHRAFVVSRDFVQPEWFDLLPPGFLDKRSPRIG